MFINWKKYPKKKVLNTNDSIVVSRPDGSVINFDSPISVDTTGNATFRGDVTIEGNLTVSNSVSQTISFGDNDKLKFGDGNDLEIYHNGTNSFIQNLTGDLYHRTWAGSMIFEQNQNDGDIIFKSDDQSGGTTTYFTVDGSTGYVRFEDNRRIAVGSSDDFMIYHDGTDTKLSNVTGTLQFHQNVDDSDIIFFCDDGSGGTTEYLRVDGGVSRVRFSKDVKLKDNVNLRLGDGNDTLIVHNGTNTNIKQQNGDLILEQAADDSDIILKCDDGSGGATAYLTLDGSETTVNVAKKLIVDTGSDNLIAEFKSSGDSIGEIRIADSSRYTRLLTVGDTFKIMPSDGDEVFNVSDTAISVLTPLTVGVDDTGHDVIFYGATSGRYMMWDESYDGLIFTDNTKLQLGSSTGSGDMQLVHDGTNSYIKNNVGDLYIYNHADDKDIIFQCDDGSGSLETYFFLDGSTTQTKFNKSTRHIDNIKVLVGSSGDAAFWHDGSNSRLDNYTGNLDVTNYNDDGDISFSSDDGSGGTTEYFRVDGGSERIRVSKDLRLSDSVSLQLGNIADLSLTHDGTNSEIANNTGDLRIKNRADDKDIIFETDDGSGGTEEYFRLDGSANTAGNPVTLFPDNSLLGFGTGFGDLQLHHDGSDSYIKNRSVGDLIIQQDVDDRDLILKCDNGSGGVTPYITLDGSDLSTRILTQKLIISNLPTSDPGVDGQVWNNSGVLNISSG